MRFYTYIHRRLDTGAVFYVGKGARPDRAVASRGRNAHWRRVVEKHGFQAQIVARWPTNEDAYAHEQLLIACFRELGAPLVNATDGGPGPLGLSPTAETRAKQRLAKAGRKLSPEHKAKIAEKLQGRPVSEKTRAKLACAARKRRGEKRRPYTAEHRARISAGRKRAWAESRA